MLHFEAEWADECTHMNAVITELAKEFKHTHFIRVGAEEAAEVTQDYGVDEVPTCIVLKVSGTLTNYENITGLRNFFSYFF